MRRASVGTSQQASGECAARKAVWAAAVVTAAAAVRPRRRWSADLGRRKVGRPRWGLAAAPRRGEAIARGHQDPTTERGEGNHHRGNPTAARADMGQRARRHHRQLRGTLRNRATDNGISCPTPSPQARQFLNPIGRQSLPPRRRRPPKSGPPTKKSSKTSQETTTSGSPGPQHLHQNRLQKRTRHIHLHGMSSAARQEVNLAATAI